MDAPAKIILKKCYTKHIHKGQEGIKKKENSKEVLESVTTHFYE